MLPPGFANSANNPQAIGSEKKPTMGMVVVRQGHEPSWCTRAASDFCRKRGDLKCWAIGPMLARYGRGYAAVHAAQLTLN
jgi:hypothetical protein